jgi:hypothetical protein
MVECIDLVSFLLALVMFSFVVVKAMNPPNQLFLYCGSSAAELGLGIGRIMHSAFSWFFLTTDLGRHLTVIKVFPGI